MKKKKIMKGNKGITLVALVVTIIVLLILAGISLNLVLGQNGIISRTKDARNQTTEGQVNTEKAVNELTDTMEKYIKENEKKENSETETGINKYNIGDEVAYTYDVVSEGYSLPVSLSGFTKDQTVSQSSTVLKWKIIDKDEGKGTIDIVSAEPASYVSLKGAKGYNNGVDLLNDICEKLYSNTAKGIKARSINLEDMEKHLTDEGFSARNTYKGTLTYGKTKKYTTYKRYPTLYASQIGAGTDTTDITQPNIIKTIDPYKESSKRNLISSTETSWGNAGDNGLTITQTYYGITINKTNYGTAATILASSNWYWVAARWAADNNFVSFGRLAFFGIRNAGSSMGGDFLYNSLDTSSNSNAYLRPIVSLKLSDLTGDKNENGAWTLK